MRGAQKSVYCFITDENGKFIRAVQQNDGSYLISKDSQPYPIKYNPSNIAKAPMEFATNSKYFGMVRSIAYPLNFIKDGAAILRDFYHFKKGIEQRCYLTIVEWNGSLNPGRYVLSYSGKIDFNQKDEDPKTGAFSVSTIDDSAWGVLSQRSDVTYAIDCSPTNPKAIRVLFDGITLKNNFTYQTVQAPVTYNSGYLSNVMTIPFVKINEDGDSAGVIVKDQTTFLITPPFDNNTQGWFFSSAYPITGLSIRGTFMFQWNSSAPIITDPLFATSVRISIYTSKNRRFTFFGTNYLVGVLQNGKIYSTNIDIPSIDLDIDEKLFLVLEFRQPYSSTTVFTLTPIVTNIVISTLTIQQPQIAYALRPLDLLQQIVSKATDNRFSINSLFFAENNKTVCLSGDSIRGIPNAKIYSSFDDFFQTFDCLFFMALRNINGQIWMEKATEVYKAGTSPSVLLDIGDAINVKLSPAIEYYGNEVNIGSPDVDLRHPSGRLEFNAPISYSLPIKSVSKKYELITKYRMGCYDIQFLIMDYKGSSTKDNSGDKSVYVVKITDEQDFAIEDIETFENIDVDDAILEPIIKSPLDNDVISSNHPTVKGIAPPGSNVDIYIDTVLDGNTTADSNGNWVYEVVTALESYVLGISTGVHIIQATFTDIAAPTSSITLLVDTALVIPIEITYPLQDDNLYNNKPLIKGVAQAGTVINISLDGTNIATVTTDNSCKWEFKVVTPFTNAAHTISVNGGADTVDFNIDSNVSSPLITYIGSELDGFPVLNNLPLIQGVAAPGTAVDLYLNYIFNIKLGTAIADANGNWSYQVVPVTYLDPVSGLPVIVAPIQNGLNIISTSLLNQIVKIVVSGYKLSRPSYSSITGVLDNTVFNTELTPDIMMENRFPLWASILAKQPSEIINFQKASKNGNLRTVLDGVTRTISDDIPDSSLGSPIALLEYATLTTKTNSTFARVLENFNNGGFIKTSYRGNDLYLMPIGNMKMASVFADVQEWKLLFSPMTTYSTLLNLYKNGLTINLMRNAIYHSDYNTLHFVTYDFAKQSKYNVTDLYDDWFNDRNNQWLVNPDYIQKIQVTDPFRDQIITNGISNVVLRVYNCKDGRLIDTILYEPVSPIPINPPEVVLEASIDPSLYLGLQIFFVMSVLGTPVAISERMEVRTNWPGTILIESSNSIDLVGIFFRTGFKSIFRVEGLIKKFQPEVDTTTATEQDGDTLMLHSLVARKRVVRFGTARGLPDYLYLPIADALVLDQLMVEGVNYTLKEGEKITPSDDVDGFPLYYYNVNLDVKTNEKGAVFQGVGDAGREGVILVVDATAFGLPMESLINIEIDNG